MIRLTEIVREVAEAQLSPDRFRPARIASIG
jgi:hypothetical protein